MHSNRAKKGQKLIVKFAFSLSVFSFLLFVSSPPNSNTMQQLSEHFALLKFSFLAKKDKEKEGVKMFPGQYFGILYLARNHGTILYTAPRCPPFCRSLSFIKTTWKKFFLKMG